VPPRFPDRRPPCVLSIAGSDSGGGAGIQADLKAFAACGVHGMTAITAITAQNTVGVTRVATIAPDIIIAQVLAVAQDIGVDAVKIGMLATAETIDAVARALEALDALGPEDRPIPVVIDPVMVSESGAELLSGDARAALARRLLPRASVVTP
jgi:hydroxymethylpyrimidine/phosphomethylpyrimidine kinase